MKYQKLEEAPTPGCYLKSRYVLAFMMFLGIVNMYSLRNNMNVTIVAMVNSTSRIPETNGSNEGICLQRGVSVVEERKTNGYFLWNGKQQGLILGCYFYGYMVSTAPGGYLADRYGVKPVLGISMLLSSVLTLLHPVTAYASFPLFVTLRIFLGFLQGVTLPAVQSAWGKWAPPLERSVLVSATFAGTSFGNFATFPITGLIAGNLGWEAVFYITGAAALVWSVIWLGIIHNSPLEHPRTSEQEAKYILESIGKEKEASENSDLKLRTPWIPILTSLPVWGIIFGSFASNWGSFTLTTMLPTYMAAILKFNLCQVGGLSSLPFIFKFLFTVDAGYITDSIRRYGTMTTTTVRKLNTTIGLAVPALFVVLAGYVGCDASAAIAFLSLSMAFNAFTVPGCKANVVDIAPEYGGVIFGISNVFAGAPGFLGPQVVGIMIQENNSPSDWQAVFWLSAAIYLVGALVYLAFGSGEEQKWASGEE